MSFSRRGRQVIGVIADDLAAALALRNRDSPTNNTNQSTHGTNLDNLAGGTTHTALADGARARAVAGVGGDGGQGQQDD